MSVLVLMVGIPGSGKTTLRNNLDYNATVISPDDFIGYTKDNPWTPKAAKDAWRKSDLLLKEALIRKDELIIFDATFVGSKKRSKYIGMAKKYDADVIAVYCKTPFEVALERNNTRESSRKISKFVMDSMLGRLEPPVVDEGFKYILTFETDTYNLECIEEDFVSGLFSKAIKKIGGLNK